MDVVLATSQSFHLSNGSSDNGSFLSYSDEELYGPKRDALYIVIPMSIVYVTIFITGLVGNVSTCIVIARNKSMHTATNYYLFSLAISDLLLLVLGLPQEIYSIWSRYPYVFGYTFCLLRGLFAETSANATVLTITAFTIERYVAICHPFLSHTMSKLHRVVKLILFIWIVSICFAIPQAVQFEVSAVFKERPQIVMCHIVRPLIKYSFEVSTIFFFVLPMTLITVLYALIGFRLRSSTFMKRHRTASSGADSLGGSVRSQRKFSSKHHHPQGQNSRRVLKMLVAVVVAFFICWAPFHVQRLLAIYTSSQEELSNTSKVIFYVVTYVSGILYYVSTTINPLLYNIMSNKFREAFKETFNSCCGFKSGRPQRSYSVLSRSNQRGAESSDYSYKDDHSVHTNNSTLTQQPKMHSTDTVAISNNTHNKRCSQRCDKDMELIKTWHNNKEICIAMVPRVDRITPSTRLVTIKVASPPPTKLRRIFMMLRCGAMGDPESCQSTPVKEESLRDCCDDISNSSLRDVELFVLQDELSVYMENIHLRET